MKNITKCRACGEYFDGRDLAQVSKHVHDEAKPTPTRERKFGSPEECLVGKSKTKINLQEALVFVLIVHCVLAHNTFILKTDPEL